jgi:ankyrin repeat protein
LAALALACALAAKPAPAVEAAACRELELKFDLIKRDMVSVQLNSALFSAADAGCEEFGQRLLAAGASLAARDRFGAMPLARAARSGQRAVVALFLTKGAQIDGRDIAGATALYLAAESQRQATVALLLAKGADPNLPTREGTTPLMAAAGVGWVLTQTYVESKQASLEAVKLCVEKGADVNAVNSAGITALHGAALRGSDDIIEFLAKNGARLDVKDKQGRTPSTFAEGIYMAGKPPERRPATIALLQTLASR